MSHQFKPGDLALTLGAIPGHIDAGVCVEVLRILLAGDRFIMKGQIYEAVGRVALVVWDDRKFCFDSRQLIPLRGDFTPEAQKAREAEPCA